jgi:proline iminopeptidase
VLKAFLIRCCKALFMLALAVVVLLLIGRWALQAQTERARTTIDATFGVNELYQVDIGGVPQWIHARGKRRDLPVLLFLHGGPGTPMMPLSYLFQSDWESHFIVVQWDQRLTGKTYYASDAKQTLPLASFDRMKADTVEVMQHLLKRHNKEKLVLVGHSWGTILGDPVVRENAALISAYVATGVVVNTSLNEAEAYRLTLAEAKRLGRADAIAALEKIAPYPPAELIPNDPNADELREWERVLGVGVSRRYKDNLDWTLLSTAFKSPEYSWRDLRYFLVDESNRLLPQMQRVMYSFDAGKHAQPWQVPVVYLLGRYDYQTPSTLAAQFFESQSAPAKQLVWLEDSAHSPMIDEPQAFAAALIQHVVPIANSSEASIKK